VSTSGLKFMRHVSVRYAAHNTPENPDQDRGPGRTRTYQERLEGRTVESKDSVEGKRHIDLKSGRPVQEKSPGNRGNGTTIRQTRE
jgi:hypothetical protein